jgi:hypothetical protein
MKLSIGRTCRRVSVALAVIAGGLLPVQAQTLLERSAETRFQVDFRVPDAALARMLPAGWEPNIATSGAAKDANLRLIVIDRLTVSGADGKPLAGAGGRLAWLAIPVKKQGAGDVGQMIVAGLTDAAAEVPGVPGTLRLAVRADMRRTSTAIAAGGVQTEEHWLFEAADGERIEIDARFERAPAMRSASTVRFHSPINPDVFQVFRIDMGIDIMRNATVPIRDRVSEFRYRVGGGRLAALFDGTERVLSIDAFPWYDRTTVAP